MSQGTRAAPRSGRSGLAASLFAALILGACQAPPPEPPPGPPPEAASQPIPAEPGDLPETAALPPEPEIDDDPAQLLGLDRAGLDDLLGEPEMIRRDPPAEIWQYRGTGCIFDVFLYDEAGRHRVTYLEARDSGANLVAARDCLHELLRARQAAAPLS